MKKLVLAAIAAAACAAGTTSASAKTVNIALDGFCNTFALTIDGFEIYGTRTGCGYTVIDGGAVAKVERVKYDVTSDTQDGTSNIFVWYFTPAVNNAGSWYLYSSTGTAYTELNSGTYTESKAGASQPGGADVTKSPKRFVHTLPTQ